MGREVVRVPLGWQHPTDSDGEPIVGAHHEALYTLPEADLIAFQVYENVSDGSPVSPVFANAEEMKTWLSSQGMSAADVDEFVGTGFAPSFVVRT